MEICLGGNLQSLDEDLILSWLRKLSRLKLEGGIVALKDNVLCWWAIEDPLTGLLRSHLGDFA
jgi:hypothetical protein